MSIKESQPEVAGFIENIGPGGALDTQTQVLLAQMVQDNVPPIETLTPS